MGRTLDSGGALFRRIFILAVLWVCLFTAVIPNSFQMATFVALSCAALFAVPVIRWRGNSLIALGLWLVGVCVTLLYVLIGVFNGAPVEAVVQVLVIYVVSPLLWIVVSLGLFNAMDERQLASAFGWIALIASASVGVFYLLYFFVGPHAVSIFRENANIHLNEGYVASTMHVYGALIFFVGGLYAAPSIISSRPMRALLIAGTLVVALTSGRAALMLAVVVGTGLGVALHGRLRPAGGTVSQLKMPRSYAVAALAALVGAAGLHFYTEADVGVLADRFLSHVMEAGGAEREGQAVALLEGAARSFWLGSGHGVAVDFVRSERFSWRYELIWIATLHRVGVLGSLIYFAPFALSLIAATRALLKKQASALDMFFLGALATSLMASFTNPYIEAFTFQWMFVVPFVWFAGGGREAASAKRNMIR